MADEKKTHIGTPPGRTQRPTGGPPPGVPPPVAPPKTSYLPETVDPLLGTTIAARYLVVRKLGEGGMGAVYLATHTILEKHVALKILHGEFARKPDLVERFMQEAKAASRIRHENVIDISDFGSTPEGLVFFAMELLHGHDLHDEVTRARVAGQLLPWSRSKKIFLQICAALAAAHAKGIVHRDLKPENIYLVDFLGDPDFVKLLDFGIAKQTEVSGGVEGGRKLTKTGMLFGTPEYMSPEQARGEHVDHRVDVYAMGCILFQLVCGRVPFEAENFMGVLSMHLTEAPPQIAPETFDNIGAPRALGDVIDRALAKDRETRWQTIDELAAAVRAVSGDPPAADRSQPHRAPSVPAPVSPTRARPPTAPVVVEREATGRVKTQWTGSLKVPEVAIEPARPPARSKLPWVAGAVILVGGGAIAAWLATQGAGRDDAPAPVVEVGSAAIPPRQPPPPPPTPTLATVTIELDSTPRGAAVTDVTTGQTKQAPASFSVPGSLEPRQFKFHLHGYRDAIVELVPDHVRGPHVEALQKGAAGAGVLVHHMTDTAKPVPELVGSGAAVTRPEPEPARPDAGKPPEVAKPPDCDEPPCLKPFGSGSAP